MTTTISIHLSNCQRTKYLAGCNVFSLVLSCLSFSFSLYISISACVCVCVTSVIDIIKKNDEKKEMEKINVNNQILVYKFIWYIPFEDWSFDDIIYTLVGSIVTVCFALHLSKHYTYLTIDYSNTHTHILKKDKAHLKRIITLFLVWLFTHTFSLSLSCSYPLSISSRIQIICVWMTRILHHLLDIKIFFSKSRQYKLNEWAIICDWCT